jgi:NADPH:quinone reductase-like Zn-dependent oxidoreductase
MDAAGVVQAVGAEVCGFATGDQVIAMLGARFGGHAEYARVQHGDAIALKPGGMSFEEAVTLVFGGLTARAFLSRVALAPGARVLVNGASGAVGTAVIQLAAHAGAHVTAVCSDGNRALATSLGADCVIDYTTEDFTAQTSRYDVIVDCVGNAGFQRVQHLLTPHGALLLVIADLPAMLLAPVRSRRSGKRIIARAGKPTAEDLAFLVSLAEAGHYRAVRDRTYHLSDIVAAHRFVDTGRKRGNVVVRFTAHDPATATTTTASTSKEALS